MSADFLWGCAAGLALAFSLVMFARAAYVARLYRRRRDPIYRQLEAAIRRDEQAFREGRWP